MELACNFPEHPSLKHSPCYFTERQPMPLAHHQLSFKSRPLGVTSYLQECDANNDPVSIVRNDVVALLTLTLCSNGFVMQRTMIEHHSCWSNGWGAHLQMSEQRMHQTLINASRFLRRGMNFCCMLMPGCVLCRILANKNFFLETLHCGNTGSKAITGPSPGMFSDSLASKSPVIPVPHHLHSRMRLLPQVLAGAALLHIPPINVRLQHKSVHIQQFAFLFLLLSLFLAKGQARLLSNNQPHLQSEPCIQRHHSHGCTEPWIISVNILASLLSRDADA